jgi:hypothetical protein
MRPAEQVNELHPNEEWIGDFVLHPRKGFLDYNPALAITVPRSTTTTCGMVSEPVLFLESLIRLMDIPSNRLMVKLQIPIVIMLFCHTGAIAAQIGSCGLRKSRVLCAGRDGGEREERKGLLLH